MSAASSAPAKAASAKSREIVVVGGIAPVLIVPDVFEPALRRRLIDYFEETGGKPSGFMKERDGRTVELFDTQYKSRRDRTVTDEGLCRAMRERFDAIIRPRIAEAFHVAVTHIERHLIARYDADANGRFAAHKDNTTRGTVHRQFACTINLNTENYAGGELRFPTFGSISYRPPSGAALIFSCSLTHEALPVTAGRRYAVLPFFYDRASAAVRDRNLGFIGPAPVG